MRCTGLKKWVPAKRSGRPVAPAISVTESAEVLEAKRVASEQCIETCWKSSDLELHRFRRRLDHQVGVGDRRRELVLERQALLGAERRRRPRACRSRPPCRGCDGSSARPRPTARRRRRRGWWCSRRARRCGRSPAPSCRRRARRSGRSPAANRCCPAVASLRTCSSPVACGRPVREGRNQDAGIERMPVERSARVDSSSAIARVLRAACAASRCSSGVVQRRSRTLRPSSWWWISSGWMRSR